MQSLWMLFATFAFSIMGVCVKLASDTYSVAEIIMYRGVIGVIFIYALILQQGGSLKTTLIWQHLWRCAVGVTALWLWFVAIGLLPLASAMTLNYMAPIWISGILFVAAWRLGKRRFEWGLVLAIVMSFIGVTLLCVHRYIRINGWAVSSACVPACCLHSPICRCAIWGNSASRNRAWYFISLRLVCWQVCSVACSAPDCMAKRSRYGVRTRLAALRCC